MANAYPEIEDQEGTRIEKVLLTALVAFLLVGGFWALGRIETVFPLPELGSYGESSYNAGPSGSAEVSIEDELGVGRLRGAVQRAQKAADNRQAILTNALATQRKAEESYKFRREEYRTAMQAGNTSAAPRAAFESARAAFQVSGARVSPAQVALDDASKILAAEQLRLSAAEKRAQDVFEIRTSQRNVRLFGCNFGFAAACLGFSWILWQQGRSKRWRYLTILTALFTASVLQLLFLLFRYCWALFVQDFAALGVSALGTAVCILAIVAIKRWLYSPERLSEARLGARRCTICATPFLESQNHCWKCGRPLVENCPQCGASRLLFAPHCGNCGVAS